MMRYDNMDFWEEIGIFPNFVNVPPLFSDVLSQIASVDKDEDFEVIVNASRPLIFNFDYQRLASHGLSESDKEYIELCILNHFITRRISSGNLKKWRHWFKTKIQEIMPYYCDMLWSMKIEYNPIFDHELWDEFETKGTNNTQQTGTLDSTVNTTGTLDTKTKTVTDEEGTTESIGTVDTTVDTTGTTDTTVDTTTATDTTVTDKGTVDTVVDTTSTAETTGSDKSVTDKDTTGTSTGKDVTDEVETDSHTGSQGTTESSVATTDRTKNSNGTSNETETHSDSRTTLDRYSDTPQGDSSKIWEITADSQGRPVARLKDIYLTNVRGITETMSGNTTRNGSTTNSETGKDTVNGAISKDVDTESTDTKDHDVTVTRTGSTTGTEDVTVDTTRKDKTDTVGKSVTDTDTTGESVTDSDTVGKSITDTDTTGRSVTDTDTTDKGKTTHDSVVDGTVDTDTTGTAITDTDTSDDTKNQHEDSGKHHFWGTRSHTYQALVKEYRENLLQLIGMICEELEPLFYQIIEDDDFLNFV